MRLKKYILRNDGIISCKIGDKTRVFYSEANPFFLDLLNEAYELGRQDEFRDNIKKTNKLMRKYPILRKAAL